MGDTRVRAKGEARHADAPALAAIGLEAEFALVIDGAPAPVETMFRDPRDFLGGGLVHRRGTSYHLPSGGIVYFDTGVIEVATPIIEIARGCGARATRSLWESIGLVRDGLARWERRTSSSAGRTRILCSGTGRTRHSWRRGRDEPSTGDVQGSSRQESRPQTIYPMIQGLRFRIRMPLPPLAAQQPAGVAGRQRRPGQPPAPSPYATGIRNPMRAVHRRGGKFRIARGARSTQKMRCRDAISRVAG